MLREKQFNHELDWFVSGPFYVFVGKNNEENWRNGAAKIPGKAILHTGLAIESLQLSIKSFIIRGGLRGGFFRQHFPKIVQKFA